MALDSEDDKKYFIQALLLYYPNMLIIRYYSGEQI